MGKKTQSSVEYIMVVAIGLVVIVPIIYMFYSYSHGSTAEIETAKIQKMGNDIINNAENIYYLGEPSRTVLKGTMPDGVKNISIARDWDKNINEVVFILQDGSELAFFSNVNLANEEPVEDIQKAVNFTENARTQGLKNIRLEAKRTYISNTRYDYVLINIT